MMASVSNSPSAKATRACRQKTSPPPANRLRMGCRGWARACGVCALPSIVRGTLVQGVPVGSLFRQIFKQVLQFVSMQGQFALQRIDLQLLTDDHLIELLQQIFLK